MSQDDVLALRRVYEQWSKGNFSTGELFAPDIVFKPFPERSALHGAESVAAYMREFLAQWTEYRVEGLEFIPSEDAIVVRERQHATGARSGIETTMTFYAIWRFRDGRVVEVGWEDDRDKALKAAGPETPRAT